MSNGTVERVFSTVKLIKSRRSRLSEDTLDHLVRIAVDGPPLAQWDATDAVHLWWRSKQRRQVQDTRVEPRPGTFNAENNPTTEYNTVPLELYYTTHMYCFKTYYDVINNWGDPERVPLHGTPGPVSVVSVRTSCVPYLG